MGLSVTLFNFPFVFKENLVWIPFVDLLGKPTRDDREMKYEEFSSFQTSIFTEFIEVKKNLSCEKCLETPFSALLSFLGHSPSQKLQFI